MLSGSDFILVISYFRGTLVKYCHPLAEMAENFSYQAIKLDTSGKILVNGTVYSTRSDVDWESTSNCVYCYKTWCGQLYVGATTTILKKRFASHKGDYKKGRYNMKLYEHFRKGCCYCTRPPTLYVLEIALDKEQLKCRENWYIVAFDTINTGLNSYHNFSGQSHLPAAILEKVNPEAFEVKRDQWRKRNVKRRQDPVEKVKMNERNKLSNRLARQDPVKRAKMNACAKLRYERARNDPEKKAKMNESSKLSYQRALQDPVKRAKINESAKLRMREKRRRLKEQAEQEKLEAK